MADLVAVSATGDRRATLEAVRDELAAMLAARDIGARDTASLMKLLVDVVRELDELPAGKEASPIGDLAAAREARRRAAAEVSERPAAGDKRRSGSGGARGKRGSDA